MRFASDQEKFVFVKRVSAAKLEIKTLPSDTFQLTLFARPVCLALLIE